MANNFATWDTAQLRSIGFMQLSTRASLTTAEVAQRLGEILHLEGISEIQTLAPMKADETSKNRYSGLYGTQPFPLHTDMAHWHIPPRYFLLRCVHGAETVPTYIVRSHEIFGPEAELTLKRALFRPRRRLDGRLTCLRLHEADFFRWDPVFLQPVNALAADLRSRVLSRAESAQRYSLTLSAAGDCIVVDNWATLHGRADITPDAMHRRIERVYLKSIRV